ncbi:hypothetical protein SAMN04488057_1077 [Cyclobacterium lianum]|uniref:Uncharacterized protein n=1 Tax=Cyclobacterium lianum TaxID=388280 RepID=A0A1M7P5A8_9BACT|nr:hypothetical protein [Cyclobacterium lianum]SHN11494.1 hypothetical protein SAMN04488057_1077 [Cyclobacterium lianum]
MKFFFHLLINALAAYILGPYLPYWVLMILIALISARLKGPAFLSFFAGALGVGLVWLLVPLLIWSASGSGLPDKFAQIMGISNSSLLVGITALMGFLIGGSSALTGNLLGKLFSKDHIY